MLPRKNLNLKPLSYSEDALWSYYTLSEEEITAVLAFLEKPPSSFKMESSFEENVANLTNFFGVKLCPDYAKQPYVNKAFLEVTWRVIN